MNTANKAMTRQLRDVTGQFGHGLDKVCRCGKTKGKHLAIRPFPMDDGSCAAFKAAKAVR